MLTRVHTTRVYAQPLYSPTYVLTISNRRWYHLLFQLIFRRPRNFWHPELYTWTPRCLLIILYCPNPFRNTKIKPAIAIGFVSRRGNYLFICIGGKHSSYMLSSNNTTNKLISECIHVHESALWSVASQCNGYYSRLLFHAFTPTVAAIYGLAIAERCQRHFHFQLILWWPREIFWYRKIDIPIVIFSHVTITPEKTWKLSRCFAVEVYFSNIIRANWDVRRVRSKLFLLCLY